MKKIEVNMENCEKHSTLAAEHLALKLGWVVTEGTITFAYFNGTHFRLDAFGDSLDVIHEAELAVIQKVGIDYAEKLIKVLDYPKQSIYAFDAYEINDLLRIAKATALQKLCACLLALGVYFLEVE